MASLKVISRLGLLWASVASLALPAVLKAQDFNYTTNNEKVLVLKQEMFASATQRGWPRLQKLRIESPDGATIRIDQLPLKAKEGVVGLESENFGEIESVFANDPRTIIREMLLRREPERQGIFRLDAMGNKVAYEPNPPWFEDLSLGNKMLECVLTNITTLDFCVTLAGSFGCEFGFTPDGKPLFRNKTAEAKAKYPIYVIKP